MREMDYSRIIITGASSGLGEAFARALATSERELWLIARRSDRLETLADELRSQHPGIEVQAFPCDLADAAARKRLVDTLTSSQADKPTLLLNNAGSGDYGPLADAEPQKIHNMLQVNTVAPVELTRALVPGMLRTGGGVVNIASLAADVPLPDFALYAASKSFVASFSEGLRLELRGSGVRVLAVCPGPVHTEFGSVARRPGYSSGDIPLKPILYTAIPTVVQGTLKALAAGKARYYPSAKIWLAGCLLRILPLWALRLILRTRPRRITKQGGES